MRFENPGCRARVRSGDGGFTLVELLTVVAVLAILTGIGFGVLSGVHERAATGKARSELAALALALESFRAQHGDYPASVASPGQTQLTTVGDTGAKALYRALNGQTNAKGDWLVETKANGDKIRRQGAVFIRKSLFSLKRNKLTTSETEGNAGKDADEKVTEENVENMILDPWGRAYRYYFDPGRNGVNDGENGRYLLFSLGATTVTGEDDVAKILRDGIPTAPNNTAADNIYANE